MGAWGLWGLGGDTCVGEDDWQCPATWTDPEDGEQYYRYLLEPSVRRTNTTDVLVDMSGRNVSQWILNMDFMYRFVRYGGFSFGEHNRHAPSDADRRQVPTNARLLVNALHGFLQGVHMHVNDTGDAASLNRTDFAGNLTAADVLGRLVANFDVRHNAKVWYNNKGWAALPVYMNTLSNALLRLSLPDGADAARYGIITIHQPMNYSAEEKLSDFNSIQDRSRVQIFQAVLTILAFSIVPASFVLFLIDERVSHAKHLQFVTGVPPWLYWTANLVWDLVNFTLPVVLVFVVFWCSNSQAYVGTLESTAAFFTLMMLYGLAAIPLLYVFTFVIRIAPLAFVLLGGGSFFLGVVTTLTVAVLRLLVQETPDVDPDIATALDICQEVFLVLPQYCLGISLIDMNLAYAQNEVIRGFIEMMNVKGVELPSAELFSWDKLGKCLFCLFVEGVIGFMVVLFIEYRASFCKCLLRRRSSTASDDVAVIDEDADVTAERRRVMAVADDDDHFGVKLKNLTKKYGRKVKAVDRLTLGVTHGECFGLLGVNGAGKTTTFKMITSKISMTAGDAFLNGLSVRLDMHRIHQSVGYCPQFDALNGLLTGREQLAYYARIRGVRERHVNKVVDWAVRHMNLSAYGSETTRSYSGGNRRKLSTALALVGDPAVVLLDEPSTGMDPNARRFMWNRILQLRKQRRTVVLTSHSMEECEALCTRIGIMVSGRMKCIGSVQHLKDKYGEGYTLTLKLSDPDEKAIETACELLQKELPHARLTDVHCSQVTFKLPATESFSLSEAFDAIQRLKRQIDVEDYALSQTTLDEVFVNFAAKADGDPDAATPSGDQKVPKTPPLEIVPLTDKLDISTGARPENDVGGRSSSDDGRSSSSTTPASLSPGGSQLNADASANGATGGVDGKQAPKTKRKRRSKKTSGGKELVLLKENGGVASLTPVDGDPAAVDTVVVRSNAAHAADGGGTDEPMVQRL